MRPLFAPGDHVHITPARAADVQPGDVVVLDLDGQLLLHRLIYKTTAEVVTRGDDAPAHDPPQPHAALIGRVVVAPAPLALHAAIRALFRR